MSCFIIFVFYWKACGFLFGSNSGPEWDSLSITWGPNPLNNQYFAKQPLTVEEAKKDGFEQISSGCQGNFIYLFYRVVT